jgi:hypothetical protein
MLELQLYTSVAAQVFKVLQQIMHNIRVIWPHCVSQEVFQNVFEAVLCLFFNMIHGIFKEWMTHEFMNLKVSKNTCFQLIMGHSAILPTYVFKTISILCQSPYKLPYLPQK